MNRAYLRDFIVVTGLIILFKLDSNRRFFSPCDFEIWWMPSKNKRAFFLYYLKFCASFQTHWWIQNWSYSPETLNSGQNRHFLSRVALKFDRWPWKTIEHLCWAAELQSGNAKFGSKPITADYCSMTSLLCFVIMTFQYRDIMDNFVTESRM